MDVSPRELRDIEIGSEFRGYNRDEVDELLERAATTIEGLTDRVLQLTDRINALSPGAPAVNTAPEAPAAVEPAAAPAPPLPAPTASVSDGGDLIQRTLLLAQKTADDTVAEAEEHARKVRADADAHAAAVVGDAEARARSIQDEHKAKLEHEVIELSGRRDALLADIDTLSTYDENFRAKIRAAIEADLNAISERPAADPGPRPGIHQIEVPTPAELSDPASNNRGGAAGLSGPADVPAIGRGASATNRAAEPATNASGVPSGADEVDSVISLDDSPAASGDQRGADGPGSTGSFFGNDDASAPAFDAKPSAVATETASVWDVRTAAADSPAWLAPSPGEGEPVGSEVLDDDAFFATLRDAVRDDAPPLGAGDSGAQDEGFYGDEGGEGRFGGVFRRRR